MLKYVYLMLVVITAASIAFNYYTSSEATKALLTQQVATLNTTNEQQSLAIQTLQTDYAAIQQLYSNLTQDFRDIEQQRQLLLTRLQEHDLAALAYARPGLVTNIINRASANALRCFEIISGAPLTEQELNATNAQNFNSECPWLFPR